MAKSKHEKRADLWIRQIEETYQFTDPGGRLALDRLGQALSDCYEYEERIRRDGALIPDRFGQLKPHPLLPALRDARSSVLQTLKLLALECEAPFTGVDA